MIPLVLCAVLGVGEAAEPTDSRRGSEPDSLVGVFRFSESPVETAGIGEQIEAAIATMDFFIRPLARYRLKQLTKPAAQFTFEPMAGGVRVVNEWVSRPCRFDGGANQFKNRLGKEMQSVCTPLSNGIREDFVGLASGTWSHAFRLAPDGTTLVQAVVVKSPDLGRPLEYTVTYARE